jgi:regulator of sirC expression with transglutaminase-like and TPR domain
MLLAQELDIPVFGVNLPEHFILCYQHSRQSPHFDYAYPDANILFYINAFSRGTIFGKEEVDSFLKKLKIEPLPVFYEPCSNTEIIKRILRNLHFSFEKLGDVDRVAEINLLLGVFNE